MISRQNRRPSIFLTIGLASLTFAACSSDDTSGGTGGDSGTGASPGSGGGSSAGKGGSGGSTTVGSGGTGNTSTTGGTGGSVAGSSTGTGGSAGKAAAGGTGPSGTGGTGAISGGPGAGTGGMGAVGATGPAGGAGGSSGGQGPGGGRSNGGAGPTGGAAGAAAGSGGTSTGSGGMSGTCQKGQTKGADVVIMGESFYAIDPQYIQNRIQDDARMAGSLGASDKYRNVAVSGQNMNYIATTEWSNATQGGAMFKLVIMDGGGIDCLSGNSCPTCKSTFQTLLGKMASAGVKDVIYTRYPEPGNPPGSNSSLKSCLDGFQPDMQSVCEASTSPKCHWVDLRPVWMNGDTQDGLHPTQSGGEHVGDLIWSEMVKDCLGQ